MGNTILPASTDHITINAARRAALEAKLNLAIRRAQKSYQQVGKNTEPPKSNGPIHLGTKIDIRV